MGKSDFTTNGVFFNSQFLILIDPAYCTVDLKADHDNGSLTWASRAFLAVEMPGIDRTFTIIFLSSIPGTGYKDLGDTIPLCWDWRTVLNLF